MLDERYGDYSVRWLDAQNYVLIRHSVNEESGEATETREGYFNSIENILKEVAKREADHRGTIREWLLRYRDVLDELHRLF